MSKPAMYHIFGALHRLEHRFGLAMSKSKSQGDCALAQQRRILAAMRRAAVKAQLHLAANNPVALEREMLVFYGLQRIVSPEVKSSLRVINGVRSSARPAPAKQIANWH